jgi:hypothetical protein
VKVRVITPDEMQARVAELRASDPAVSRARFELAKIAEARETILCWWPGGRFTWVCPSCGEPWAGYLGDKPVSGWTDPRWVNTGTAQEPTLIPSLGCPNWRAGRCDGHWRLLDGELVPA